MTPSRKADPLQAPRPLRIVIRSVSLDCYVLVQNVCCRHRPGFGAEDDFPDHDTKTAFELPIRRASAKRCGLRLVVAGLRAGAQFGWVRPLQANGAVDDSLPQRPATKSGCFEVERTA